MEILGYLAAILIGLSLGLTGSGGSILTVPILVYLMRFSPVISTAYSLFVVGLTSMVGSFKFYRKGLVNFKTAFVFGAPSLLAVLLTRRFVVPAIPEHIITLFGLHITKGILLMVIFAILMVFASFSMIRKSKYSPAQEDNGSQDIKYIPVLLQGVAVGFVSGLVGAGGGFLIIPALVLFTGLDMKMAVGTSLFIIAANSLLGFVGDIFTYDINWGFLITFSALSVFGIFIGSALSTRIQGEKLKTGFGWFVLAMGVYILIREIFLQ
ncbi:sulfite exporter TauE/SafE family protein [Pontibacter oryzae]|uniref:Probable membrane transporter protein n=1 Tax=Pontibacter oryzae TaxID=2304593 RepID=A0A399SEA7_9BACT|nr:sulfite exporter TauE/SafE family protein [Pontibacter oryzae]RIJ42426.1 sulfite exporter TauE/SafE family protein [Pontibacter oryzae]